ncbi:MAG: right-handed parallel beta-helix repeat-containing protein [bacterium]
MRRFLVVLLAIGVASSAMGATITVKKDGSADIDSVALALATISNGDTIIIADSATYEEDLTAGALPGFAASFTLKAADGQTPVIQAVNGLARLEALGIPGTDYMGALFFGCQGVLIEGITFQNLDVSANLAGISGVLTLMDSSDITVRNCTIRAAGAEAGYPADNVNLILAGVTMPPTGIVVEDCISEDGNYGLAVAKLLGGTPTDPSTIVRNCIFRNLEETGIEVDSGAPLESPDPNTIAAGQGNLFENCTVINANTGIQLGGGYNVIRNCEVLGCREHGFDVDLDGDRGTQPITGIVEDSVFIGCAGDGVRIDEGIVSLTNCIVAGSSSEGIHLQNSDNLTTVTVDQCDIYHNLQESDYFEVRVDVGGTDLVQLKISNSNVITEMGGGILNGSVDDFTYFDEEGLFASYCNVISTDERYVNVVVDNDLQVAPAYVSPSIDPDAFTREGFRLPAGSSLLTAGKDGTYIGSQGSGEPVGVKDWSIY